MRGRNHHCRLFCQDRDLHSIDIMKLDVQGAEFFVLSGATKMLSSQSISMVYMELILASTYQGQKNYMNTWIYLIHLDTNYLVYIILLTAIGN
jgi:hypothetical protein